MVVDSYRESFFSFPRAVAHLPGDGVEAPPVHLAPAGRAVSGCIALTARVPREGLRWHARRLASGQACPFGSSTWCRPPLCRGTSTSDSPAWSYTSSSAATMRKSLALGSACCERCTGRTAVRFLHCSRSIFPTRVRSTAPAQSVPNLDLSRPKPLSPSKIQPDKYCRRHTRDRRTAADSGRLLHCTLPRCRESGDFRHQLVLYTYRTYQTLPRDFESGTRGAVVGSVLRPHPF